MRAVLPEIIDHQRRRERGRTEMEGERNNEMKWKVGGRGDEGASSRGREGPDRPKFRHSFPPARGEGDGGGGVGFLLKRGDRRRKGGRIWEVERDRGAN